VAHIHDVLELTHGELCILRWLRISNGRAALSAHPVAGGELPRASERRHRDVVGIVLDASHDVVRSNAFNASASKPSTSKLSRPKSQRKLYLRPEGRIGSSAKPARCPKGCP
jgi:hypothetical protein